MSRDAFSPSEGLAPGDFRLLFRLLDGQPSAVLAPFKHVQANDALPLMIEAMARNGCTLGEIAYRVNARANVGTLPDYGFLVLGDPEITVVGCDGRDADAVKITKISGAVAVLTEFGAARRAFTATVPAIDGGAPIAVLPISANSRSLDIFFALGRLGDAETMDVTLFRKDPFEPGPFEFALMPAYQPDDGELERGRVALRRARLLSHIFGACEAVATAETALRELPEHGLRVSASD